MQKKTNLTMLLLRERASDIEGGSQLNDLLHRTSESRSVRAEKCNIRLRSFVTVISTAARILLIFPYFPKNQVSPSTGKVWNGV